MTPTPHPAIAARRARVRRIRNRVAAGATALFIALFSGLYIQMASGNDPALGASSGQVAAAVGSSTSSDSSTSTDTSSSSTTDSAPMTTSAS